jgi:hypothetical protein
MGDVAAVTAVMAGFRGRLRQDMSTSDDEPEASCPGGPDSGSRGALKRGLGSLSDVFRGKMLQVGAVLDLLYT